jgi:hypothetical protein
MSLEPIREPAIKDQETEDIFAHPDIQASLPKNDQALFVFRIKSQSSAMERELSVSLAMFTQAVIAVL